MGQNDSTRSLERRISHRGSLYLPFIFLRISLVPAARCAKTAQHTRWATSLAPKRDGWTSFHDGPDQCRKSGPFKPVGPAGSESPIGSGRHGANLTALVVIPQPATRTDIGKEQYRN